MRHLSARLAVLQSVWPSSAGLPSSLQATLSLLMDALLSDQHATPGLFQSIGRVVNALVAVFGPEFMPGTTVYQRCKVGGVVNPSHLVLRFCDLDSAAPSENLCSLRVWELFHCIPQ